MIAEVDHPKAGRVRLPGMAMKLSKTRGEVRLPSPLLGQHAEEVLGEVGVCAQELKELRRDGVV